MIRVNAHKGAAGAKSYYTEALSREDYYSQGQEVVGLWHGKAAERLGIGGQVERAAFCRMCDNLHPLTGEQLTPRIVADRIVGWDINFHAPKSFSLVQAIGGDDRLLGALRRSVSETMREMETRVMTRIRAGGAYEDRHTGNFAWAEFLHLTARPVGGIPDPHAHIHAFTFNATFDPVENRWKAAKVRDMHRDLPYFQAYFHARLAWRVAALGYEIRRTRDAWEIVGVPREIIDKFSKRTRIVEEKARELGISDAKAKDLLGAMTRKGKDYGITGEELHQALEAQLGTEGVKELEHIAKLAREKGNAGRSESPEEAMEHAIKKLFARDSVVWKSRLLAAALHHGVGKVRPELILAEYDSRGFIEKKIDGQVLCTDLDVLTEEVRMVAAVRGGKGRFAPMISGTHSFKRNFLSGEQRQAVLHILQSKDWVLGITGGAGTGKTTTMEEAVEAIKATGRKVYPFAPSASASRGTLRESGFANAETLAHFFANESLQKRVRGQVVWVDEAGLIGARDMWRFLELVGPDTRVILTGDTKQHGPVARGEPFRILQRFAGMRSVEITQIRRQKPEDYKKAVSALARGDMDKAITQLEQIGAIREIEPQEERHAALAEDYLSNLHPKSAPLVVSPTRREAGQVTGAIRTVLKDAGRLKAGRVFTRYKNTYLEEAERAEPENYRLGMLVQYHQNAPGITRGARFVVTGLGDRGEVRVTPISGERAKDEFEADVRRQAARFQVYESEEIEIAKGERLRITRNGFSKDGRRLNNGHVREVVGFTRSGDLKLKGGGVIDRHDGHFNYGYCTTSHSSQSRTVGTVLVAQSSDFSAAASREQFYVTVSRGAQQIRIYTDNRLALAESVGQSSHKISALELADLHEEELEALMAKELDGKGWRAALEERRVEPQSKSFMERIAAERRTAGLEKGKSMNWTTYVEMRRAPSKASGKHREIGYPNKATKPKKTKGYAGLKRVEPKSRVRAKEAGKKTKQNPQPAVTPKPAPMAKAPVHATKRREPGLAKESISRREELFRKMAGKRVNNVVPVKSGSRHPGHSMRKLRGNTIALDSRLAEQKIRQRRDPKQVQPPSKSIKKSATIKPPPKPPTPKK